MTVDVVSEEIQVGYTMEAFVGVDDNAMGGELFKNSSQINEVLFWGRTGNEDIVNVGVC